MAAASPIVHMQAPSARSCFSTSVKFSSNGFLGPAETRPDRHLFYIPACCIGLGHRDCPMWLAVVVGKHSPLYTRPLKEDRSSVGASWGTAIGSWWRVVVSSVLGLW